MKLTPIADSNVRDAYAYGAGFGDVNPMAIRGTGGNVRAYLKFALPAGNGSIGSARLKFYFGGPDTTSFNAGIFTADIRYSSNSTWVETTIAGNASPPVYDTTTLGTLNITTATTTQYTISLNSTSCFVGKNGTNITLTFLQNPGGGWGNAPYIYSREDATKAPELNMNVY